LARKWVKAII
jgi:hypothetical protein